MGHELRLGLGLVGAGQGWLSGLTSLGVVAVAGQGTGSAAVGSLRELCAMAEDRGMGLVASFNNPCASP